MTLELHGYPDDINDNPDPGKKRFVVKRFRGDRGLEAGITAMDQLGYKVQTQSTRNRRGLRGRACSPSADPHGHVRKEAVTALRLAGYARVSTDGQVLQAASIPEQAADLRAWCEEHGHTFVELCAQDDAVSGTEGLEGRLAFIQALDLVKTGEVDGILVRDLDRFGHEARNTDQSRPPVLSCPRTASVGDARKPAILFAAYQ